MKVHKKTNKMPTSYPLKVQAIRSRGQQPRLYVSFPLALAAAIGLDAHSDEVGHLFQFKSDTHSN